jgi:hypothetical protein
MNDLRQAAQQALEALVTAEAGLADIGDADREQGDDVAWCEARAAAALEGPRAAITALRDALAQPLPDPVDEYRKGFIDGQIDMRDRPEEQEPVAWSPSLTYPNYEKERVWLNGKPRQEDVEYWSKNGNGITYVYTAPPRREWQSLSEDELTALGVIHSRYQEESLETGCWFDFARAVEAALKEKNNG